MEMAGLDTSCREETAPVQRSRQLLWDWKEGKAQNDISVARKNEVLLF